MRKRSLIIVGILVLTVVLLTVPLVLAGEGDASFSRSTTQVESDPIAGAPSQGAISITHSLDQSIIPGNSVSCNNGIGHTDNAYLRKFTLADFSIVGNFDVTDVEVAIESATAGAGGTQPATVNLYTWDPNTTFVYANFTLLVTSTVSVPDSALTKFMYPIAGSVPAGGTLVVEYFTPDGQTDSNLIWVGSNDLGQTDDTYLAAAGCGLTEPTPTGAIGFGDMHWVVNVYGDEVLEPEMSFDKTVGLDPGTCAATDSISVPAGGGGTDVTYCYSVENTGLVTLTYHTLVDDQLGTLLGPDAMYEIGPGDTYVVTATALITETTVNIADWTVTDGEEPVVTARDIATVTVEAPTGVALSGFTAETTNLLVPMAFAALLVTILGAGVLLQRKSRA